jgi:hypothetical protein
MKLRLAPCAAAALVLLAAVSCGRAAPGNVYLVLGSDTAVWNYPGGINPYDYHNHFSLDLYTQTNQNAYRVMDPAFRGQFADFYGQPLKMTWWMLVGSVYGQSDNTDVPIVNLMPLYLMQKYHGAALGQFGDELTLHYHTFYWSDYSDSGVSYWNEAQSFHDCRADFDQALAQSLLEAEVFPVSFRSGWHYMDNEWQNYLNQLLLYSMDNDSPNYGPWYTNGVIFNVLDWSQAPLDFIPFNPSPTNYQVPGQSPGWNVRSVKMQNVTQTLMNDIFAAAAAGTDQVASLWAHLAETDFLPSLVRLDELAHAAATNYPTVPFLYCTAVEAMQRWRGLAGQTPLQLGIIEQVQGETVTLALHTDKPIFQPQPFVAVKDLYGQYQIVPCPGSGTNSWTAVLPVPRGMAAKYGVAMTDLAGNLTTRIVRYVPDDLFIDNLDSGYQEASGQWASITAAGCWGIDARSCSLATNPVARASWVLPITAAGPYNTFVQVPAVDSPAGQVQFNLLAGGTNVLPVFFAGPLPASQWIYLGTPLLNPGVSNVLEMVVSAQGQTNRVAVADVVKLSPLILPQPGFIRNVRVEPYNTTANITWQTPAPATTLVEYGLDTSYGRFSATNSQPVLDAVVTLAGLQPGTTYYFRARSTLGELDYTYDGSFTTTNFMSPGILLFDVTNTWKYDFANLDGSGWEMPGYDDSAWPAGPGLLWVDVRTNGPNPAVGPKGTQMPADPTTNYPYITYYFRSHFNFPQSPAGVSLTFSNYIDDGAVFYLNGVEIRRNNMAPPPTVISNNTLAIAFNCQGDATCPVLFSLAGKSATSLVQGDDLLAVEVHNYSADSPDITFGSALYYSVPYTPPPRLHCLFSAGTLTLYWNGTGLTLQEADRLGLGAANWTDFPGPITVSPCAVTVTNTAFFRLRQ